MPQTPTTIHQSHPVQSFRKMPCMSRLPATLSACLVSRHMGRHVCPVPTNNVIMFLFEKGTEHACAQNVVPYHALSNVLPVSMSVCPHVGRAPSNCPKSVHIRCSRTTHDERDKRVQKGRAEIKWWHKHLMVSHRSGGLMRQSQRKELEGSLKGEKQELESCWRRCHVVHSE